MNIFYLAEYQVARARFTAKTDDVPQYTFEHEQRLGHVGCADMQGFGGSQSGIHKFIFVGFEHRRALAHLPDQLVARAAERETLAVLYVLQRILFAAIRTRYRRKPHDGRIRAEAVVKRKRREVVDASLAACTGPGNRAGSY